MVMSCQEAHVKDVPESVHGSVLAKGYCEGVRRTVHRAHVTSCVDGALGRDHLKLSQSGRGAKEKKYLTPT